MLCIGYVFIFTLGSNFHVLAEFLSFFNTIQAAFHGSAEAAKILLSTDEYDGITLGLHKVVDKEGKTPIDLAQDEKNSDVEKVIRDAADGVVALDTKTKNGMRKRK